MLRSFMLGGLLIASFASNAVAAAESAAPSGAGFSFQDDPGQYLDILLDGKIVGRYMYAHDTSSEAKRVETYKPYLHVFDAEGKAPITKGTGGVFPHHRGIFIGFNKIEFNGKNYDRWHMPGGEKPAPTKRPSPR
jgi:Methane oxygenase PmoA